MENSLLRNGESPFDWPAFFPALWFALFPLLYVVYETSTSRLVLPGFFVVISIVALLKRASPLISPALLRYYALFLVVIVIGILLQTDTELAANAMISSLPLLGLFATAFIFAGLFRERVVSFLKLFGVMIVLAGSIFVLSYSWRNFTPSAIMSGIRLMEGSPMNPNLAAFTIAGGIPFLFFLKHRNARWLLCGLALICFYATGSRISWLALPIGGSAVLLLRSSRSLEAAGKWLLLLFALLLVFLYSDPVQNFVIDNVLKLHDPYRGMGSGFTGRVDIWKTGIEVWKRRPWFGYGFRACSPEYLGRYVGHNGFIVVMVNMGIVGLFVYLSFVIHACLKLVPGVRRGDKFDIIVLWYLLWYLTVGMFEGLAINFANPHAVLFFLLVSYVLIRGRLPNGDAGSSERAGPPRERPAPLP